MNLHGRKIVGWAMANHLRADQPLAAVSVHGLAQA
jgi:hypothetical protein